MKHVALIRPDNSIEIHEELADIAAPERMRMLGLQVDLYGHLEGIPGYRTYMGEAWPPAGFTEEAGALVAIEPEPEPAPNEEPPE